VIAQIEKKHSDTNRITLSLISDNSFEAFCLETIFSNSKSFSVNSLDRIEGGLVVMELVQELQVDSS